MRKQVLNEISMILFKKASPFRRVILLGVAHAECS